MIMNWWIWCLYHQIYWVCNGEFLKLCSFILVILQPWLIGLYHAWFNTTANSLWAATQKYIWRATGFLNKLVDLFIEEMSDKSLLLSDFMLHMVQVINRAQWHVLPCWGVKIAASSGSSSSSSPLGLFHQRGLVSLPVYPTYFEM